MKKFVSLLLVFVLSVSCMIGAMPVSAAEDDTTVPLGDVNIDGDVDVIDATLLQRYCVGMSNIYISFWSSDVDDDGYVTIIDVTLIQRYLAGLSTFCDIGTQPVVIDRNDNNDDLYYSTERFDKAIGPWFGDGTAYLNNVLLTNEDLLAFHDNIMSRDSVDWFFEKYHLTEDDGWTVWYSNGFYFDKSLSDEEYMTKAQNEASGVYSLSLSYNNDYQDVYKDVDMCDYDISIHCDSDNCYINSHTGILVDGSRSAFMNDFNEPFVFNNAYSIFGNDSVVSFDADSYRGLIDAFGLNASDFDDISTELDRTVSYDYAIRYGNYDNTVRGRASFNYDGGHDDIDDLGTTGFNVHLYKNNIVNKENHFDVEFHRDGYARNAYNGKYVSCYSSFRIDFE